MLIVLSFKAQSGKDTAADYLVAQHNFKKLALAEPLKEACQKIFGFTHEQLYGSLKEVVDPFWGFTPRFALQKIGTDCLRDHFDKTLWIKAAKRKILAEPATNWVISDCRFPDEAIAMKEIGGYVVRIDRPLSGATGGVPSHSSEVSMDAFNDWDYILKNDINVHGALYDKVEEMLEVLNGRNT
jgi:hypothetical protein